MADAGARFTRRWEALSADTTPRETVRAILTELLPLDDRRREEAIVLGAFNTAALTGGSITAEETPAAPRALVTLIAERLERSRAAETTPAHAALDAELILATVGGIAQGVLAGHYTAQTATELVERLLDLTLGTKTDPP